MNISEVRIEFCKSDAKFFVVGPMGVPLGGMYDFYSCGASTPKSVLRSPYPFWKGQKGFDTLDEASEALQQTVAHMEAVIELPSQQRIGSSKFWKP
jgi:hypothetical protein